MKSILVLALVGMAAVAVSYRKRIGKFVGRCSCGSCGCETDKSGNASCQISESADVVQQRYERAKESVMEHYNQMKEEAKESYAKAEDKIKEVAADVKERVEDAFSGRDGRTHEA